MLSIALWALGTILFIVVGNALISSHVRSDRAWLEEARRSRKAEVDAALLEETERLRIAEEEAARLEEAERLRMAEEEATRLEEADRLRMAEEEAARLEEAEQLRMAEEEAARLEETGRLRMAEEEAARLEEAERLRMAEEEAARLEEAERLRMAEKEAARLEEAERLRMTEELERVAEEARLRKADAEREGAEEQRAYPVGYLSGEAGISKIQEEPGAVGAVTLPNDLGGYVQLDPKPLGGRVRPGQHNGDPVPDQPGLPDVALRYYPASSVAQRLSTAHFPVVELPVRNSTVKGTRIGKMAPRGISERGFLSFLSGQFEGCLLSSHRIEFTGARRDYEPDIILHKEEMGLRIDVEIDEPYSGISRKPMHWLGSYDDDRDVYFSNNGWIVVRFAEEQVVKQPASCAAFLAELIDSLVGTDLRSALGHFPALIPVARWTYDEAKAMADAKHRESYLGVEFEHVVEEQPREIEFEEDLERAEDDRSLVEGIELTARDTGLSQLSAELVQLMSELDRCIKHGHHLIWYSQRVTYLMRPRQLARHRARTVLHGYDLLGQSDVTLDLRHIEQLGIIDSDPVILSGSWEDPEKLRTDINTAIDNQLCMQITYQKSSGEESDRTVSMVHSSLEFGAEYIGTYCHLRKELRTFKLNRIRTYKILGLKRPWEVQEGGPGERIMIPLAW